MTWPRTAPRCAPGSRRTSSHATIRPRCAQATRSRPRPRRPSAPAQAQLYEAGYLGITVPIEYGGQGLTRLHQQIWDQEARAFAVPSPGGIASGVSLTLVVPTLLRHGSDELKRSGPPKILSGEEIWCQFYSEPEAGSDLAGIRTSAMQDGDHYVLNGSKIWSTGAYTPTGQCAWPAPTGTCPSTVDSPGSWCRRTHRA